ncbi:histidine phosphatase family protein [Phaeobacter gallaeciensis]|uniref:histidine phosphatase family protein n=1 Tax=Phaeobacter gallaeciensis TaxID=60890 RepID=UPI0023806332|nr:histidine phosphatase family protein [Phaeobacter gallaeciensis]MDE4276825.1 histidine phosphatase family protein [Phaeobacter gallaeciensis]MDE4302058.1 histidine phosphatase family protein [Phaeobacter gallaeciensis]MDE5187245.1 histidine phosphatase family protein [Phaeobacter gallaeciensis]
MKHSELFILRHGETSWNLQGKFQGRQDSPLTEKGIAQALRQKTLLASIYDLPSRRFCSPQGRALHTARLALDSETDLTQDNRLQEIDFGKWEGVTRDDIRSQIDYPFESGLWNFRSPQGEDFEAISGRVKSFLDDLDSPAVIVTHGTTSIVMRGLCMGLTQDEILKLPKDQGCIYHVSNGVEKVLR